MSKNNIFKQLGVNISISFYNYTSSVGHLTCKSEVLGSIKVGREIPVAGIPSGNYRPGKYSKFGQSGKYWEICSLRANFAKYSVMFL